MTGISGIHRLAYGIGTAWFKKQPGDISRELVDALKSAIEIGYRHIDAAQMYGNEQECGIALQEIFGSDSSSTISATDAATGRKKMTRADLFVTTKYDPKKSARDGSGQDALEALRESLKKLKLDKVDLYLIHNPYSEHHPNSQSIEEIWQDMERCHEAGLTTNIGVSNFTQSHVARIDAMARVPVFANQVELHPYHAQPALRKAMADNGVQVESYGPLVPIVHKKDGPLTPYLEELVARHGRTEGQILLRWNLQKGNVVITTSGKVERMREQLQIFDFELSEEEVGKIDEIGSRIDYVRFKPPPPPKQS